MHSPTAVYELGDDGLAIHGPQTTMIESIHPMPFGKALVDHRIHHFHDEIFPNEGEVAFADRFFHDPLVSHLQPLKIPQINRLHEMGRMRR